MLAYTGVNATPLDATAATATASNTSVTTNSLTTTAANSLILSAYGSASPAGAFSGLPIAGTTTRYDGSSIGGVVSILVVDELKAAAGASTGRTATHGFAALAAEAVAFKSV
jgi:hypothetical protein